jgi:hypothetical protein
VEEPRPARDGINVTFGRRSRDLVGSLDFQIALLNKKAPYFLEDLGPLPEELSSPGQRPIHHDSRFLEIFQGFIL